MRRVASLFTVLILIAACTTIATHRFDDLFGPSDPQRFDRAANMYAQRREKGPKIEQGSQTKGM